LKKISTERGVLGVIQTRTYSELLWDVLSSFLGGGGVGFRIFNKSNKIIFYLKFYKVLKRRRALEKGRWS